MQFMTNLSGREWKITLHPSSVVATNFVNHKRCTKEANRCSRMAGTRRLFTSLEPLADLEITISFRICISFRTIVALVMMGLSLSSRSVLSTLVYLIHLLAYMSACIARQQAAIMWHRDYGDDLPVVPSVNNRTFLRTSAGQFAHMDA